MRFVTGCLRPTPTDYLPILAGIQPAELRRRGATLSLANRATLNPDHILHEQLVGKQKAHQGRLKSRRPFVPAAQKLLDSLTESDIRAAQWMDYVWNMEYLKSASRLHAFIPRASPKPLGIGLPRTSWVKLNRVRTGVGQFHSSMYKWGVAPSPNCECGASEQTADHIISTCPLHRAPKGIQGLLVLDDDTRRWLKINAVNIWTVGRGCPTTRRRRLVRQRPGSIFVYYLAANEPLALFEIPLGLTNMINDFRRAGQRCFGLLALISRPQVKYVHLPERMILPGSFFPSDKYILKNLTLINRGTFLVPVLVPSVLWKNFEKKSTLKKSTGTAMPVGYFYF